MAQLTPPSRPARMLRCRGALPQGCSLAILGGLILVLAGSIFVIFSFDAILIRLHRASLDAFLNQLQLPEREHAQARDALHRVPDAFEDGMLDREGFEKAREAMGNSPEWHALGLLVLHRQFIVDSRLDEEEKSQAEADFNRFCRALIAGDLTLDDARDLEARFLTDPQDPESGIRQSMPADELRQEVLPRVRNRIEGLDHSGEPLDVAVELHRAVDRALEEAGVEPRGHDLPRP